MALIHMNIMSKSLMRTVNAVVVLPIDKLAFPGMPEPKRADFSTIYLLHGILGSEQDWVAGTRVQRWAEEKGTVLPNLMSMDCPFNGGEG